MGEKNDKNRYLHVRWKDVKQDIQEIKQDIGDSKQDIGIPNELSSKTKQHIRDLFCEFGYERFFGRSDVQNIIGITASPSSALLKRMLELDLIYPMKGKGKGKYLFRKLRTLEEVENMNANEELNLLKISQLEYL